MFALGLGLADVAWIRQGCSSEELIGYKPVSLERF